MRKSLIIVFALILSILIPLQSISVVYATNDKNKPHQIKKVLVKLKEGKDGIEKKTQHNKIKNYKKLKSKNLYQVEADEENIKSLKEDEDVELIEEDSEVEKSDDKITWNINKINSPELYSQNYYGNGIKVAVFDTGIDLNNNDLNVVGGASFVDGIESYDDDNGHGTAMGGILCALKNNYGLMGVAPEINLYSVKVLDSNGVGTYSNIIEGIQWAIDNRIDIIEMSLGGTQYSKILKDAINEATNHNILVIAAAGNEGCDSINYPANYSDVICVGAVDSQNKVASFSNRGDEMDLVAPGVSIETAFLNNTTATVNGTSAAVPHIAGVAAQLWSAKRELTNTQIKTLLYKSTTQIGDKRTCGWGLVNAGMAINNINSNLDIPIVYEQPTQNTEDSAGDGTVQASAIIISGDNQHIQPGASATVCLRFDVNHSNTEITIYNENNPSVILNREYRNVTGVINTYYTAPAGVMNTPGTYKIKFWCPDAPSYPAYFTIYVDQPTPPPPSSDDYGNSTGAASSIPLNSWISGNINYAGDLDYFRFTASISGTYTLQSSGSTDMYGYLYDSNGNQTPNGSDDDGAGYPNFKITEYLSAGQTYYLCAKHFGSGTGAYNIMVTAPTPVDDYGNTMATASTITIGSWKSGNIDFSGDIDYFKFTAPSTGSYTIESSGSIDMYGNLYDSNGNQTPSGANDDGAGYPNLKIVENLTANQTYYIAARHYSTGTGAYSVRVTAPQTVEITVNPEVSGITANAATITWSTNINSDSVVEYGTTTSLGSTKSNTALTTSHSLTLTGLTLGKKYYYRVKSSANGITATYPAAPNTQDFTTLSTVLITVNPDESNITRNSVVITWTTNLNSNSVVEYGTTTSLGLTKSDTSLVTSHSIALTGLNATTTYYYRVKSTAGTSTAVYPVSPGTLNFKTTSGFNATISNANIPTSMYIGENNESISAGKMPNCSTIFKNCSISLTNTGIPWTTSDEIYLVASSPVGSGIFVGKMNSSGVPEYQDNSPEFRVYDSTALPLQLVMKSTNDAVPGNYTVWFQMYDKKNNSYFGNKVTKTVTIKSEGRNSFFYMRLPTAGADPYLSARNSFFYTNGTEQKCDYSYLLPSAGRNFAPEASNVSYTRELDSVNQIYKLTIRFKWDNDIGAEFRRIESNPPAYFDSSRYFRLVNKVDIPAGWRWKAYETDMTKDYTTHKMDFYNDIDYGSKVYKSNRTECEVWTDNPGTLESNRMYYVTYTFTPKPGYSFSSLNKDSFLHGIEICADRTRSTYANDHGSPLDIVYYNNSFNPQNVTNSYEADNGTRRKRNITVACPVKVHIYDSQGRHMGPNEDGIIEEGIPGGTYEIYGETKFISLDDNDTYRVVIEGYDDGNMNIKNEYVTISGADTIVESSTVFNKIPVSPVMVAEFNSVPEQSATELKVDMDGDGIKEGTIAPTATINNEGQGDRIPPVTNCSFGGTLGNNGWYTSDVSVALSATDIGGGTVFETSYSLDDNNQQTYYAPFIVSTDGNHLIQAGSVDTQWNYENTMSYELKIDKTAPDITLLKPQNPQYGDIYTLLYNVYDGVSGVEQTDVTMNGNPANLGDNITLPLGDTVIKIRCTDAAGNISEKIETIHVIDSTLPVSKISLNGTEGKDGWFKSDVNVEIVADDEGGSGIKETVCRLNGTEFKYEGSFTVNTDGMNFLEVCSIDAAGNFEPTGIYHIEIDREAPEIYTTGDGQSWTNQELNIAINCYDWTSGIDKVEYSWSKSETLPGNWVEYTSDTLRQTEDGTWYLFIRAVDNAGNESQKTVVYNLDKIKPDIKVDRESSEWGAEEISVTPIVEDAGSGLYQISYAWLATESTPLNWNYFSEGSMKMYKEGIWYLHIKAEDMAGNIEMKCFGPYKLDKSAPVFTVDIEETDWANSEVRVKPTITDELSGILKAEYEWSKDTTEPESWETYTDGDITQSNEGIWYLHTRTTDAVGNMKTQCFGPYKIDKTAPQTSASPENTDWSNRDVKITPTYTDEGGAEIKSMEYAWTKDSIAPTNWNAYTAGDITQEAAGIWYLYLRVIDNAGNETVNKYGVYRIDKTPPTTTAAPESRDWSVNDITVTPAFADEGGSELKTLQYAWVKEQETPNLWNDYTSGSVTQNAEGIWYLCLRAEDNAGNVTVSKYGPYKTDRTKPDIKAEPESREWTNSSITVTPAISDTQSRVAAMSYKWSNSDSEPVEWNEYNGQQLTVEETGIWYLHLKAQDNVGNVRISTFGPYKIDKIAPTVSATPESREWLNQDAVVIPVYSDEGGSQVALRQYSWSLSQDVPGAWNSYLGENITQGSDGIWYLHLKVVDGAGNETINKYGPYKVDKTLPVITNGLKKEYVYGDSIKLQFEAADALSGIKETYVRFYGNTYSNGTEVVLDKPGTYNVEMVAVDIAGNIRTVTKQVEIIVPANINIDPNVINLKNLDNGNGGITAYIELPGNLNVNDIIIGSIKLNNTVVPVTDTKYGYVKNPVSDYDGDGKLEFMVKFSKENLVGLFVEGKNTITINGQAANYRFMWTGILEAKNPGKK